MGDWFWRWLRALKQRPLSALATLVVGGYVLLALFGSSLAPYDYATPQDDLSRCVTRANGTTRCAALENTPPSIEHPFGTDRNGRDVFSRILYGARLTIGLPLIATTLAVMLGVLLGLSLGYIGGWYDELVARLLDSLLAIPSLILALVAIASIVPALDALESPLVEAFGSVNLALVAVILLLYAPIVARVTRSATLSLRGMGYVEAARLRGESLLYILLREILPNILPTVTVEAALRFSYAIFLVASLGFLGLGAQPPLPEWGRLVLDARSTALQAPWALWYPVGAIALLIISVNLMADSLQRGFSTTE